MDKYIPSLVLLFLLCLGVRFFARALLFRKKLGKNAGAALIPFKSDIDLYACAGEKRYAIIGTIARMASLACIASSVFIAEYANTLSEIHIYGVILGNYQTPEYLLRMEYAALILCGLTLLTGFAFRLMTVRQLMLCFGGRSSLYHFVGMMFPGILYLMLALAKDRPYLLNKSTKKMSREEYILYTHLTDK